MPATCLAGHVLCSELGDLPGRILNHQKRRGRMRHSRTAVADRSGSHACMHGTLVDARKASVYTVRLGMLTTCRASATGRTRRVSDAPYTAFSS